MYTEFAPDTIAGTEAASSFKVAFATSEVTVGYRQLNGKYRVRILSDNIDKLALPVGFTVKSARHASAVLDGGPGEVTKVIFALAAAYIATP